MLNIDSKEWWMWQMYRATAEFMHNPSHDREARLKFFLTSYRYFHLQQNGTENPIPNKPTMPYLTEA